MRTIDAHGHSYITSTFYVYEDRRKLFHTPNFDNTSADDLHLQIIESISPKASVENSSANWAMFFITDAAASMRR